MKQMSTEHKNIKINTPCLTNDRKSNNKPLQGGKLLIHHINSQHKIYDML
jgi:hypothetical protein